MIIKLVIFDCDGVLVDSEPISNRLLAEMMTQVGLPITTEEVIERFMGRATPVWLQFMADKLGEVPEGFLVQFRQRCAEVFAEELKPIRGVEEILETLVYPFCVASSGPYEKMHVTLGITGLLPRFEKRLFSAQDVAHGKPAPDIFLYAAEKMKVSPENCVVVEDTVHGVRAGRDAGMRVLGYAPGKSKQSLKEAGAQIFDDMTQLPGILDRLK